MKAMDGVEEEKRPDALVEVVAAAAEVVELPAVFKKQLDCGALAQGIQREIAPVFLAGYDARKVVHEEEPPPFADSSRSARSSSICVSTSLRFRPLGARAGRPIKNPKGAPRSYRRPQSSMARYCSGHASSASASSTRDG